MPGYQSMRIIPPSEFVSSNEIFNINASNKKKAKNSLTPIDPGYYNKKNRQDYERYLKSKESNNFRSSKLRFMGSCNDINAVNPQVISKQRNASLTDENDPGIKTCSSSKPIPGDRKGDRKPVAIDPASITVAMMNSLRNSASEDNIFESVEMIHYLKTVKSIARQKKIRTVQKTGHSLFDSLREEQALKEPLRRNASSKISLDEQSLSSSRSHDFSNSDGQSPSLSPSSSSDEYDTYPRLLMRSKNPACDDRNVVSSVCLSDGSRSSKKLEPLTSQKSRSKGQKPATACDDEFKMIPRPKFFGRTQASQPQLYNGTMNGTATQLKNQHRRRSDISSPSEESDSSFNSTGIR